VIGRAWVDGRGNAGTEGSCAAVIEIHHREDVQTHEFSKKLGEVTNNDAEYEGVALALVEAHRLGVRRLSIYSDSQVIVGQLLGTYKVKTESLQPHLDRCRDLGSVFDHLTISWIPRKENKRADKLCRDIFLPPPLPSARPRPQLPAKPPPQSPFG
jgi:ribonuclease HI